MNVSIALDDRAKVRCNICPGGQDEPRRAAHDRVQMVIGAALLVIIDAPTIDWVRRWFICRRLGRSWSQRRRTASTKALVKSAILNVILITYMIVNGSILANSHAFCKATTLMKVAGLLHGYGWNTLLLLFIIDGHGLVLQPRSSTSLQRADAAVLDQPWWRHWRKLAFLWLPLIGARRASRLRHPHMTG